MTVHNTCWHVNSCTKPILSNVTNDLHAILKPMGIYMILTSLDFSPELFSWSLLLLEALFFPIIVKQCFSLCFIFLLSEHFLSLFSFLDPLTPAAPLDVMPQAHSQLSSLHIIICTFSLDDLIHIHGFENDAYNHISRVCSPIFDPDFSSDLWMEI